ncbi:hypothetical protein [Deinococcus sp. 6GRE01]|uniref:hypothetical protein n=1 Tax=Deinococcus sp. 6GRE01 TaxID=2745873 RepID=UPI001E324112|nr:hypothetical protein [Deinococcus sp. 6GRE01]MCD0155959.1 hypothetical protein [Deinococcus sp. 6GRE01]
MTGGKYGTALKRREQVRAQQDEPGQPDAGPEPEPAEQPGEEYPRMLGGRVPSSVFSEFQGYKDELQAAHRLRRKVTTDQGVEALVRLLRDPEVRAAWQREVLAVRARER